MENLVNYICNGSTEFTPAVMVGLIVFVLLLEGILRLVGCVVRGGRK